jgi:hypothetical protein
MFTVADFRNIAFPPSWMPADQTKTTEIKGLLMNRHMKADTGHVLMCDTETFDDLYHRRRLVFTESNAYSPELWPIKDICKMADILFDETIADLGLTTKDCATEASAAERGFSEGILTHFFKLVRDTATEDMKRVPLYQSVAYEALRNTYCSPDKLRTTQHSFLPIDYRVWDHMCCYGPEASRRKYDERQDSMREETALLRTIEKIK